MAVTATPIYPQKVVNPAIQFTSASSAETDFMTAGANGSKLECLLATSTDTADRDIQIFFSNGTIDVLVSTVKVTAGSGNSNSVPAINILASAQLPLNYDAQGNKYLYLQATFKIRIAITSTVTATKVINFVGQGGDF